MTATLLTAGAAELGVELAADRGEILLGLVDELEAANAQFNLTAIRDRPGMLRKHVLEQPQFAAAICTARAWRMSAGPARVFPVFRARHRQSTAAVFTDRGHGYRRLGSWCRRRRRTRLRQCRGGACARRNLPAPGAVRHRDGAALYVLAGFRRVRRAFERAPRGRLLAMKGKRPDEEISALPKSFRGHRRASIQARGTGRRRGILWNSPPARPPGGCLHRRPRGVPGPDRPAR